MKRERKCKGEMYAEISISIIWIETMMIALTQDGRKNKTGCVCVCALAN